MKKTAMLFVLCFFVFYGFAQETLKQDTLKTVKVEGNRKSLPCGNALKQSALNIGFDSA